MKGCERRERLRQAVAPAPRVAALWYASGTALRGYWIAVGTAAGCAAVLMISYDRFRADTFTGVRATGGPCLWSWVFVGIAVALLIARAVSARALQWTFFAVSTVYTLWAISFVQAAWTHTGSSPIGGVFVGSVAAFHLSCALTYTPVRRPR